MPHALRVALVAERDPVLQVALVCDHLRPALIRCARRAGAGHAAEDVVSDVIARRLRIVGRSSPCGPLNAAAFHHLTASLTISVRNAAVSHYRSARRCDPVEQGVIELIADTTSSTLDRLIATSQVAHLREALQQLDPRERQIARLIGIHEMTVRDVAERLDLPASSVFDVWGRVQRVMRHAVASVEAGERCGTAREHLALIAVERRNIAAGERELPLSDLIGPRDAAHLLDHVYGAAHGDGGCLACRRAIALQRGMLHQSVAGPLVGLASGLGDVGRHAAARLWDSTVGATVRLLTDLWQAFGTGGAPSPAGALVTTGVGIGGAHLAALFASAAVVTAPLAITDRKPTARTVQAPTAVAPAPTSRQSVTRRTPRPASTRATPPARATPPRGAVTRTVAPPTKRVAPTGPAAEFTPGP